MEDLNSSQQHQKADPSSKPLEISSRNAPLQHDNSDIFDDIDQPIALRKGKRVCTQHQISNFVSYGRLSSNYKTFVTNLTEVQIPKNV